MSEPDRGSELSGIRNMLEGKETHMLTISESAREAVADIPDGATVLIGGFGTAGQPVELIEALVESGAGDLTVVNNNAGNGDAGLAALIAAGRVRKIICSFPRQHDSHHFDAKYRAGEIDLELVPQGNLAERIRAAGAGIGAFFTPTGYGTQLAEGRETREIDGKPLRARVPHPRRLRARSRRTAADGVGNLVYRKTARNFGPIMAAAAKHDIVQVLRARAHRRHRPRDRRDPGHLRQPAVVVPTEAHPNQMARAPDDMTQPTQPSGGPLGRDELAALVAADIPTGSFVNLGIGQPTLVADYLSPEQHVTLHTENGMLGMGPAAQGDEVDLDLINAGKIPVTELPGASYFHHADSFAMMRGGHLDICVLGAYQVSRQRRPGQLAHRRPRTPSRPSAGPWTWPWAPRRRTS